MKLMKQRHSTRVFADRKVEDSKISEIIYGLSNTPSSCDRNGIYIEQHTHRDNKALLGGLLVGGVGWIHRAPVLLLIFADPEAYKENYEPMPYLDAGVKVAYIYLLAESLGLKACYVNPNVRESHKKYFSQHFGDSIFCGAIALGYVKKK